MRPLITLSLLALLGCSCANPSFGEGHYQTAESEIKQTPGWTTADVKLAERIDSKADLNAKIDRLEVLLKTYISQQNDSRMHLMAFNECYSRCQTHWQQIDESQPLGPNGLKDWSETAQAENKACFDSCEKIRPADAAVGGC